MIYSCFHPQTGRYRYFEDGRTVPVNGDLPVPHWLKGRVANGIGVPTGEAGRPLPSDARPAGTGTAARGLMVQCSGGPASSLGEMPPEQKSLVLAGTAAVFAAYFASSKQSMPALALGAIALGAYIL